MGARKTAATFSPRPLTCHLCTRHNKVRCWRGPLHPNRSTPLPSDGGGAAARAPSRQNALRDPTARPTRAGVLRDSDRLEWSRAQSRCPQSFQMQVFSVLALVLAAASAEVFFEEDFSGDWASRWSMATPPGKEMGKFDVTSGKWFHDEEVNKGLTATEDMRFYSTTAKMASSMGKPMVVQFSAKIENHQYAYCGGGYLKLLPDKADYSKFGGDDEYHVMFGPDLCGCVARRSLTPHCLPPAARRTPLLARTRRSRLLKAFRARSGCSACAAGRLSRPLPAPPAQRVFPCSPPVQL